MNRWRVGVVVLLGAAGLIVVPAGLRSASDVVGPGFLAVVIVVTVAPLQEWLRRHHRAD